MVRAVLARSTLVLVVVVAACSPGRGGSSGSTTSVSPRPGDTTSLSAAEFERQLRRQLVVAPMPSFVVPEEALVDQRASDTAKGLGLAPGLYEGIAVITAVCDTQGTASAADAALTPAHRAVSYDHDGVRITVGGDGSGTYSDGSKLITIQGDHSGTYADGSLSMVVEGDGSGRYDDGQRVIVVDSEGSGTYSSGAVSLTVNRLGLGRYHDDQTDVSVTEKGVVVVGEAKYAESIARVIRDRLPRFPPVPEITQPPVPVKPVCGVVIRIDANVLFDFDTADLNPDGEARLRQVAALLVTLGSPKLAVNGHTDSVGTESYNNELSRRRAESVRAVLAQAGVAAGSMDAHGFGEAQPLRPNAFPDGVDDPAGRQANRRVELVLLDR